MIRRRCRTHSSRIPYHLYINLVKRRRVPNKRSETRVTARCNRDVSFGTATRLCHLRVSRLGLTSVYNPSPRTSFQRGDAVKGKGQGWASSKTRKLQRTIAVIEIGNALLSMYLMFLTAAVNVDEIVVSVIVCVLQISMALDCARDSHPVAGHCHDRNNQPALTGIPHRDGRSSTLCPTVGTSRGTITGVVAARKALQGTEPGVVRQNGCGGRWPAPTLNLSALVESSPRRELS